MSQHSELKQVLQAQLNWHGARISFLALFLLALLKVKTVNLSDLCLGFGGRALPQSSYKRLQRFFRAFELDGTQLANLVVSWLQIPGDWVLSLDRTTWKFGSHWDNILTLGIVHEVVFAHLQPGQSQRLTDICRVWGYPVAVEALRLDDGELLVVIAPVQAQDLVKDYALRWGIETLFGIFKTRGLCLESTHFTNDERVSKLFALLTLALGWAMQTGLWLQQWQAIEIKNHDRRAKSLFRLGFDCLRHSVLNLSASDESDFVQSLQLLSCT
jgi:hypothetical protein